MSEYVLILISKVSTYSVQDKELLTQMLEDIDALAKTIKITKEKAIEELNEYYGGYHFSPASPDVFNPYSLLKCFNDKRISTYWFNSCTSTYLINMLSKFKVLSTKIGKTLARASAFDAPMENMRTITPLLYQHGYITIKGYDEMSQIFTLDLPNKEIKMGLLGGHQL